MNDYGGLGNQGLAALLMQFGGRMLASGGAGERTTVGLGQALMGGVQDYYTLMDRAERQKRQAKEDAAKELQMQRMQQEVDAANREAAARAKMVGMSDPNIQQTYADTLNASGGVPFATGMTQAPQAPQSMPTPQMPPMQGAGLGQSMINPNWQPPAQVTPQQAGQQGLAQATKEFMMQTASPEVLARMNAPEKPQAMKNIDSFVAQIGKNRDDVRQVFMVPNEQGNLTPHVWNGTKGNYELLKDSFTPISVTDVRQDTGVGDRFYFNQGAKIVENTNKSLEKFNKLDQMAELSRSVFSTGDFQGVNAAQLQQLVSSMGPNAIRAQAELEKFGAPGGLVDNLINTTKKITTGKPSSELIRQYEGLLNNFEKYLQKSKSSIIDKGRKQAANHPSTLEYYNNVFDNYTTPTAPQGLGQAPTPTMGANNPGSANPRGLTFGAPRQDKPIWGQ